MAAASSGADRRTERPGSALGSCSCCAAGGRALESACGRELRASVPGGARGPWVAERAAGEAARQEEEEDEARRRVAARFGPRRDVARAWPRAAIAEFDGGLSRAEAEANVKAAQQASAEARQKEKDAVEAARQANKNKKAKKITA